MVQWRVIPSERDSRESGSHTGEPPSAIDDLIARHVAFWKRGPVDRPLLAVRSGPAVWPPRPWPIAGGGWADDPRVIEPDDVDIERMLGFHSGDRNVFRGELLNAVAPVYPQAWMGALIGCPIHASAYGCVARPTGENLRQALDRFSVEGALGSAWFAVMDRMLRRAVETAAGQYPVEQLHMRGVVDMLAALFGEAQFCVLLFDEPEGIRRLAGGFADLIVAASRRGMDLRGPWRGGYLHRWGILAPGSMHDYQADASTILSPEIYEEVLMEYDRRVLSAFDYSLIHLHAAGLHIVEPLLRIRELDAIQINLDRETGVFDKTRILEVSRSIQSAGKSLLLCGEVTRSELDEFLAILDPVGLALDCRILREE